MVSAALDMALASMYEAQSTAEQGGFSYYWTAIIADRHYPGGALRLVAGGETMALTCGMLAGLMDADTLLLGRYQIHKITDTTPWDLTEDYDQDSPVTAIRVEIDLPVFAGSMMARSIAEIRMARPAPNGPSHIIIGCLRRPEGWPM